MVLKLLIVDDHEFTRTGLAYSFRNKEHYSVVGQASNGFEAIRMTEELRPDIIVMDIGMPDMDGIAATQHIKVQYPAIKVAMLTSRQFSDEICRALAAGADAYCMKDISTDRLSQVLDTIAEDAVWLDPAIARIVASALVRAPEEQRGSPSERRAASVRHLSERELEVLQYIAQGKSNKDIADSLCLSIHTVKSHVRSLIQKLAVDDRTQAALKAVQDGLV